MLIEAALPHLKAGRLVLDIVGDGPMMGDLRAMVAREGVDSAVTLHGWVAHEAVPAILGRANLLTFPSIREFGGGVVLEAMALGVVPVICDYAGPAELVDEATGYKIPMGRRDEIVAALRARLGVIIDDPSGLPGLSRAARTRVAEHFTWDRKARQIGAIYDWVLDPSDPIPQPVPLSGT